MNLSKNPADDKCHAITRDKNGAVYGGSECICTCHISDDENYMKRNVHCIPCGMKVIVLFRVNGCIHTLTKHFQV